MEAKQKLVIFLTLVMVAAVGFEMVAAGDSSCGLSIADLMSCKPAVSGPKPLPPSEKCCTALSKADLPCLCTFKNSPMISAFKINATLAMDLPSKCNLSSPNCA
ncbi:PREDICTED: putative lipid-transfer protein DIR1 [Nicotiana attenuata]|uniref:Lipid-transfer protein dir1 n=1 Tax=Nicotiana attenuata TaxID=49451 RepID=A0A1J6K2Q5_NICAT|nr:PREDICTED: putative lipid-transfer protein DIR1 [Nicotiana attenuata]OIT22908.1 putative lipid-transfer protein dir1 [Nicotiana attenuata]